MKKSKAQLNAEERISLGAFMLTLVISNVVAFVYLAPYA
jgi:hypothetical protein